MALPVYSSNDNKDFYMSIAHEEGIAEYNASLASSSPYNYTRQEGSTYNRLGNSWGEYDDQRPCESIPTKHHDIMKESDRLYEQVGLIRTIIDLMTDFTIQGIRIVHSQKSVEKFYQNWFNRVNGYDRSERFCSNMYKYGNVIVRRRWATLGKKMRQKIRQAKADEMPFDENKSPRRQIPSRYIFLNPATVDVIGGEVAKFVGGKAIRYGLRIPRSFASRLQEDDAVIKELMQKIPDDIKKAINSNDMFKLIPLDNNDTLVFHHKKDDWKVWAKPIIYGVMRDIRLLEKLKLADSTALDGAIDRVRIFKLGDLDNKIVPGPAAFAKMGELLRINPGAGTRNIVWDPAISMEESKTDVASFLGEEKYRPTMSAIYEGLGIPPTLTGSTSTGGTTNNLISLKVMIKKLEYGRQKLVEFWETEFELVRQTMGFQKAAVLEFDQNNLGDEEAEKRLFIELADRDIVSYEFVQKKFGLNSEVQSGKIEQEWKERDNKKRVEKASPFHKTQFDDEVKKSLINRGSVTPSEVGVDLLPRKPGDTTNLEPTEPPNGAGTKPAQKNVKPNGRPPGKKDEFPRKTKRFTPVEKALEIWAMGAQEEIAEFINPVVLAKFNKKNMRSLTTVETESAEKAKFGILFNIVPNGVITQEELRDAAKRPFPQSEWDDYVNYVNEVQEALGRDLTLLEKRSIQLEVYLNGKV